MAYLDGLRKKGPRGIISPMVGVLLAVLAVPQPSPSPLKTITHVRSSPFCTTLRENVGYVVKALIQNNAAFVDTKSLFLKMAHDKVSSVHPNMVMDSNIQRLGPLMGAISQNLEALQAKLNDAQRFPSPPRTAQDRQLAAIQQGLRAIADRQNQALNILSGTYFSYNGNRLLGHGDGMAQGDGKSAPVDSPDDAQHEIPIVLPPIRPVSTTVPVPSASASPLPIPTGQPPELDLGLLGQTKFAALFNSLTTYQVDEQPLEAQVAQTILQASAQCNSAP